MKKIYIFFLLLYAFNAFGANIYVNHSATGLNNGSSWKNAFINLQSALALAKSGDSIKVAQGNYLPTSGSNPAISFVLKRGTVLLGGYAATGGDTTDARRSWVNYPTVLSGDIIDGPSSYTLLSALNIDTATLIDGFFARDARSGGNAIGSGIRIVNSDKLTIRNIIFEELYDPGIVIINSSPAFINCIMNNISGRVIYNTDNSNAAFYNCVISGNFPGGYSEYKIVNENASIRLINSAIVNNIGIGFYGTGSGTATIQNTIFWNNRNLQGVFEDQDIIIRNQNVIVNNCITQTYFENGNNTLFVNSNPRFSNILNPSGLDNKFFTADDGLQLTAPCSPALNAGDNNALINITTDIAGKPRIYNGGTVDLGPYEIQEVPVMVRKTVFVNNNIANTGNNDGSSWQNAYKTLQQALLYCADTIKISAGVYLTTNSYADSIFMLENKKVLLVDILLRAILQMQIETLYCTRLR